MGNAGFITLFLKSYAIFQPYRISDHTPCILKLNSATKEKPKPFKFFNFIVSKKGYGEIVEKNWNTHIRGNSMFKVVKKLKALKGPLRKLVYDQGNLHLKVNELRKSLHNLQRLVDENPDNIEFWDQEIKCHKYFEEATYDEKCFLKQKS